MRCRHCGKDIGALDKALQASAKSRGLKGFFCSFDCCLARIFVVKAVDLMPQDRPKPQRKPSPRRKPKPRVEPAPQIKSPTKGQRRVLTKPSYCHHCIDREATLEAWVDERWHPVCVPCVELIGTNSQKNDLGVPRDAFPWPVGPKRKKMLDEYD